MNTTVVDPLELVLSDLQVPLVHHIDVCRQCELRVAMGVWAITRCGISKDIEGFLPSPDWVSCKDCLQAKRAACTFCGAPRKRL